MKRLILLVIAIMMVAGCSDGGDAGTTVGKNKPFIGGTSGLIIDFEDDAPPEEVFDLGAYPFDIVVKLENVGESDINKDDCTVKVSGLDPAEFDKTSAFFKKNLPHDLKKKYKDSEGKIIDDFNEAYVEFEDLNYKGNLTGNTEFPIRVDVCYKYKTEAISYICLKEDILDQTEESVCTIKENKDVYSSGAPLQVTEFSEVPGGEDMVRFSFTIKHVGSGDFFSPDSDCDSTGITYEDKAKVTVNSGISGLSCNGLNNNEEIISIRGGERVITCSQPAQVDVDYIREVKIDIEYDYEEDKSTEILVKHLS